MRKVTTILCSIAFMISGIMMAITATNNSSSKSYKAIQASTLPKYTMPQLPTMATDTGTIDLSEDLVRDLAKKKGVLDTVYITKTDTVKEQVTKVKWRKAPVASPVMEINVTKTRTDTIHVPVYYLATQVGNKEGPNNECIPIYELRKVDELCPNSSTKLTNESDSIAGAEL